MKKKCLGRWLRGLLVVVVCFFVLMIGASWYLLDYALKPIETIRSKNATTEADMQAAYPFYESWMDSLQRVGALKELQRPNAAGRSLHAYYLRAPRPTLRTVVLVHGYTDNALRMMMLGYLYNHDLGFNVLAPDLAYHGQSQGDAVQMGWKDRLDVLQWVTVADTLFATAGQQPEIVVHGISMGAATTMMLSGERHLPASVKGFVEDCGYTSVWDQFAKQLKEEFHLPSFPLLNIASGLCKLRHGWSFAEASAINQVRHCQLPMLFIHGDADTYVPTRMVYLLYDAKPGKKALWIVPGAVHAASYEKDPEGYTSRVRRFVDEILMPQAATPEEHRPAA